MNKEISIHQELTNAHQSLCPTCNQKGLPVQGQTVKSLLSVSLRKVLDKDYFFCPTSTCPIVYFSDDGKSFFTTSDIRERVYQKEPFSKDVLICYCFKYTASEIRQADPDIRQSILNEIKAGIKASQCACDLRNPQGSCCLGNIQRLINLTEAVKLI